MKKVLMIILLSFILVGCSSTTKWYEPETIEEIYYNEQVGSDVIPFGQTVNFDGLDIALTKYSFPTSVKASSGRKKLEPVEGAAIFAVQFEITNNNEDEVSFGSGLGTNGNEFKVVGGNNFEGNLYENIVDVDISDSFNGITIGPGNTETYNVYFHVLEEFTKEGTKYILQLTFLDVINEDLYIYFEF